MIVVIVKFLTKPGQFGLTAYSHRKSKRNLQQQYEYETNIFFSNYRVNHPFILCTNCTGKEDSINQYKKASYEY